MPAGGVLPVLGVVGADDALVLAEPAGIFPVGLGLPGVVVVAAGCSMTIGSGSAVGSAVGAAVAVGAALAVWEGVGAAVGAAVTDGCAVWT